jgi:ubiquitin-protein ligase
MEISLKGATMTEDTITIKDPTSENECDVYIDGEDTIQQLVQVAVDEFELSSGSYYLIRGSKMLNPDLMVKDTSIVNGDTLFLAPDPIGGAFYPKAIWQKRLRQELESFSKDGFYDVTVNNVEEPTIFTVILRDAPAYTKTDEEAFPTLSRQHTVEIVLGRGFPEEAPQVTITSGVFHPNVFEGSNAVCIGTLTKWESEFSLLQLIRNTENLFWEPNLLDPAHTEAVSFYQTHHVVAPPRAWRDDNHESIPIRSGPRVVRK